MKLLALLLLIGVAQAQGLSLYAPGTGSKPKPLITPDANAVIHVWWPKTALVDATLNSWMMNGTVPVAASSAYKTKRSVAGNPFTIINNYSLGSGSDVADFAGDFTVCVVFAGGATAGANHIFSNGTYGASGAGYFLRNTGASLRVTVDFCGAASAVGTLSPTNTYSTSANIACFGRSGAAGYAKLNGGTTVTNASVPVSAGTAYPAIIGNGTYAPSGPFPGTVTEVYATSTAWNEATVAALQTAVMAKFK